MAAFVIILLVLLSVAAATPSKEKPKLPQIQLPLFSDISDDTILKVLARARNKALTYIGTYNNRQFYYDSTQVDVLGAAARCDAVGLKLVEFATQDELDFVNSVTPEDYCWTGGVLDGFLLKPEYFLWLSSGQALSSGFQTEPGDYLGLTLSVYSNYGKLCPREPYRLSCYYCSN